MLGSQPQLSGSRGQGLLEAVRSCGWSPRDEVGASCRGDPTELLSPVHAHGCCQSPSVGPATLPPFTRCCQLLSIRLSELAWRDPQKTLLGF